MNSRISVLLTALFFLPFSLQATETPISEGEMVRVINSNFGESPLYQSKDIPDKELHSFDFNDDGKSEWVVIPKNACGITNTCHIFILQQTQKSKDNWKLLLLANGKITSLTPWGILILPRKTKGYDDLAAVFDQGHDSKGHRLLDQRIYVWNGKQYEEWKGIYPPPSEKSAEVQKSLEQLTQLQYSQKLSRKPN